MIAELPLFTLCTDGVYLCRGVALEDQCFFTLPTQERNRTGLCPHNSQFLLSGFSTTVAVHWLLKIFSVRAVPRGSALRNL